MSDQRVRVIQASATRSSFRSADFKRHIPTGSISRQPMASKLGKLSCGWRKNQNRFKD